MVFRYCLQVDSNSRTNFARILILPWFVVTAIRSRATDEHSLGIVFQREFICAVVAECHAHPCPIRLIDACRVDYHAINSKQTTCWHW